MLIQPSYHGPKVLLPVPKWEWREPSLVQPKDAFGRQNRTTFAIRGWKVDGGLIHERIYEDRDEFDYDLWRHIVEEPYEDVFWEWATTTTLTTPTGSNQTYNVPSDWNNSNNTIWTIGGGASGAADIGSSGQTGTGGGGGGCGIYANLTLTPGGTATYQIAASVAGVSRTTSGATNGNTGNDSWFNGTTYAGASVGGVGGSPGVAGAGDQNGGSGGGGKGTSSNSGGRGGNNTGGGFSRAGTGGGGAGGGSGAGNNGADDTGTSGIGTNGGSGDGGAGGAGSTGSSGGNTSNGSNGTNMDGGIGAGGGSGGCSGGPSSTRVTGDGGSYGAASGGSCVNTGTATSGAGQQGAIIITYTAAIGSIILDHIAKQTYQPMWAR